MAYCCVDCQIPIERPRKGQRLRCDSCRKAYHYADKVGLAKRYCPTCGAKPDRNCTYCSEHRVITVSVDWTPTMRQCAHCQKEFWPKRASQIYCRPEHRRRSTVHNWKPKVKGSKERGYGADHERTRARLLPAAYGRPCEMCGEPMRQDEKLDLDHSLPIALGGTKGDRIVHAICNQRAGAELGRERAKAAKRAKAFEPSRAW